MDGQRKALLRSDDPLFLHVSGDMACFTRPEFAGDRVSYPVMPFSAAVGILSNVFKKRAFAWEVERIFVLSPIRFLAPIMRNEHKMNGEHTQCRTLFLRQPEYVIQARITMERQTDDDNMAKFIQMFERYLLKGRLFKPVFLGTNECLAIVGPPPADWRDRAARANPMGAGQGPFLGRMPHRVNYRANGIPRETDYATFVFCLDSGSYTLDEKTP